MFTLNVVGMSTSQSDLVYSEYLSKYSNSLKLNCLVFRIGIFDGMLISRLFESIFACSK